MSEPKIVLIMEDHSLVRQSLAAMLEDRGYVVLQAEDGVVGLHVAVRVEPDIIVTDLMMPDIDGINVIRYLKSSAHVAKVPVVVLSIHTDPRFKQQCREAGAFAYLDKTAEASELFATLEMALASPIRNDA